MYTIDLNFLNVSNAIASFVVPSEDGPILVETGPHSTIEHLEVGLAELGYTAADVKHVLLSHIHFDHAGAAWYFAELGATIYVHPRGARHLASPEKLVASAKRIYQDQMDRLWGQINSIPQEQIKEMDDREVLNIGGQNFTAHHTPGHAVHHIAWEWNNQLFCGDVAGVKIDNGLVVPPCPPPDINIEDWLKSIERIKEINPEVLHLTHYGEIRSINSHLDDLAKRLDAWANWIKPHFLDQKSPEEVVVGFQNYVQEELKEAGLDDIGLAKYEAANPSWMSVAGLMRYWKKKLEAQN